MKKKMAAGRRHAAASPKRRELAKLLSLLDDGDAIGLKRLTACRFDRLPHIVGVTGAAGSGKSLLISKILEKMCGRPQKNAVGVLAVDPTDPATGGAFLGDRIRMPRLPEGVFFRSVATRGGTGGLSEKLIDMAAAMKAFGYDDVFIETVGIGQDELAIRHVADTLVVVEAPGMGDEIQAMKASQLTVGDILVVNKSDKPGARETAAVISETVGKTAVLVSALEGHGIDELVDAIRKAKTAALQPKTKKTADRRKLAWRLAQALGRKWTERIARLADEIVETSADAVDADPVRFLYKQIQEISAFLPDHIAIAVDDLEDAIAVYRRLGFSLERRESFPSEGVETAFFNAGGIHIELLKPASPESPIAKFVSERGGGLHHIAFEVEDIAAAKMKFKSQGIQALGDIRPGTRGKQIFFLHPKSTCRALLEFCACGKP